MIGLICAAATGAAQPLMTLVFGNLTEDFVAFGIVLNNMAQGVPGAREQLPAAAAGFRHSAALGASYLTYIGM